MKLTICGRDTELRDLLRQGHWPAATPAELRAHVAECQGCSELVTLTVAFQQARQNAVASVRTMPPGLIWWRAQLRRRQQAVDQASRPIRAAQTFALILSLCGVAGVAAWMFEQGYWKTWQTSVLEAGASLRAYAGGLGTAALATGIAVLLCVGLLTVWATADLD